MTGSSFVMLNLSFAKLRMVSLTNPFQHLDSDPPAGGQNDRFMGSIYDPPTINYINLVKKINILISNFKFHIQISNFEFLSAGILK